MRGRGLEQHSAHSRVKASSGPLASRSGRMAARRPQASTRPGRLDSTWSMAPSMRAAPCSMHQRTSGRSSCLRPSSSQRLSTADNRYSSDRMSPNLAESSSRRLSAPPRLASGRRPAARSRRRSGPACGSGGPSARCGRGRQHAAGPGPPDGAQGRHADMPQMTPEHVVEDLHAALFVRIAQRQHLGHQVRMRADGALAEDDQVARQDVGAFDRDGDGHGAVQRTQVVARPVDHAPARVRPWRR